MVACGDTEHEKSKKAWNHVCVSVCVSVSSFSLIFHLLLCLPRLSPSFLPLQYQKLDGWRGEGEGGGIRVGVGVGGGGGGGGGG